MKRGFYLSMFALAYVSGDIYGGALEGAAFPVVSQTEIERTEPVGVTRTRIWGSFVKERQCAFERIEFRLGSPASSSLADLTLEEPAKQRGGGRADFGPWVVQLTDEQIEERSFAVVFHRCHPFWLTETRFY